MSEGYWLYADAGTWHDDASWYYNMVYIWERRRGLTDVDNHFCPGHFQVSLRPGAAVTVLLSTLPPNRHALLAPSSVATGATIQPPAEDPVEVQQLYRTAHSFLVDRYCQADRPCGKTIIAGYHWFGDWGRDTMIALPGLCLTTGRYTDAAEILRTFTGVAELCPNLFIESGNELFDTVDASLWFVYAVERYLPGDPRPGAGGGVAAGAG